jgi:hypothetical protein
VEAQTESQKGSLTVEESAELKARTISLRGLLDSVLEEGDPSS